MMPHGQPDAQEHPACAPKGFLGALPSCMDADISTKIEEALDTSSRHLEHNRKVLYSE
jgi:hypothetical protein